MDAGKLNEKLSVLDISGGEWTPMRTTWGSAEQKDKKNLFSSVGIGARAVEFVVRRQAITLHDAIGWRGQHCFLTSIIDEGKGHLKIAAALIEPTMCSATRGKKTKNALNNPITVQEALCSFPACVTEKYMGFSVQQPQSQVEETLVLVCPKFVMLKTGDLVTVGTRGVYAVTVPHTLDDYKNEYEVVVTKEA